MQAPWEYINCGGLTYLILSKFVLNSEEATLLGNNHIDIFKHDKNPSYVGQRAFIYEGMNIPCSSKFLLYSESSV